MKQVQLSLGQSAPANKPALAVVSEELEPWFQPGYQFTLDDLVASDEIARIERECFALDVRGLELVKVG